jgi:primosomal protein N' (replication factor Y)
MDTARQRGFSKKVMKEFSKNQIQVLIGTQMIAKGLDFPNVSLVGVLNADIGLFMPDFRARERIFQLLYQVAGRVGRGDIQGEIVVQTFNPQNFTIQCALQKNIKKFFSVELNERNALCYPPFSRLALIQISDLNKERGRSVSEKISVFLHRKRGKIEILGPSVAPISKIKNRYRFFIILKSRKDNDPNGTSLRNLLNHFLYSSIYKTVSKQSRISVDIDPLNIL